MRRRLAAAAFILLASTPRAWAEEEAAKARSPRVMEWLAIDFGGVPLSFSAWLGGHFWIGDKYLVGLRAAGKRSSLERDLNGDGTIDFSATLKNNPYLFEVQADFGYPIRSRTGLAAYVSGGRLVSRAASGKKSTRWLNRKLVEHVCDLSLVSGARVAVGGDELQVGIPLGLRYSWRMKARGRRFREWWYQARVLFFVPAFKPAVDAEFTWMPRPYGIAVFAEYFPRLGDPDPDGVDCYSWAPQRCRPARPLTVFNRVPEEDMFQIGVRLRMTYAF